MFRSLALAASGLSAQRTRLETIATNIANAETTHGPDGQPYKRQVAVLAPAQGGPNAPDVNVPNLLPWTQSPFGIPAFAVPAYGPGVPVGGTPDDGLHGVTVAGIVEDQTPGALIYDPSHPDADAAGYVHSTNVSIPDEMVDLMEARRVYEANATVFQSAKAMLKKALDL